MDNTDEIVEQLFVDVKDEHQKNQKLSSDLLKALQAVFSSVLKNALDIIDQRHVILVTCPSGRTIYRVKGSTDTIYMCLSVGVYCECPSFLHRVSVLEDNTDYLVHVGDEDLFYCKFLRKETGYIMCKHVLACRLATAMDLCIKLNWSDEQIQTTMATMFKLKS